MLASRWRPRGSAVVTAASALVIQRRAPSSQCVRRRERRLFLAGELSWICAWGRRGQCHFSDDIAPSSQDPGSACLVGCGGVGVGGTEERRTMMLLTQY